VSPFSAAMTPENNNEKSRRCSPLYEAILSGNGMLKRFAFRLLQADLANDEEKNKTAIRSPNQQTESPKSTTCNSQILTLLWE
jgi:hypothetical protein